jgi:hypothetical protein
MYTPVCFGNSNSQMLEEKDKSLFEAKETESVEEKPWQHHSVELASGALGGFLAFLLRFLSLTPSTLLSLANDQAAVLIMSQANLALHGLVCISFFTLALACRNEKRKRCIATSSINFMIGILIGSFLAWNVVDMLLGFPLPSTTRFLSLFIMLTQCWMINRCYGILATAENETEEDASDRREYAIASNQEYIV